jgi:uncharacterized protein (TIGR03437 family)
MKPDLGGCSVHTARGSVLPATFAAFPATSLRPLLRRSRALWLLVALLFFHSLAQAQPVVNAGGILNAASYALPGLPNSDIAQGSMFVVFGQRLGPANLQQTTAFPRPTQLAGTSIRITGGGVTADAIMVYTSAGQVAAILPSRIPTGEATLTVTYNGQTSAPVSFRVARSSLGVFTRSQGGKGPGIVQNYISASEQPANSLTEAAQPGQVMILWATGLGPVDFDETQPPQVGSLNVDLEVLVAGKRAPVLYKGRSAQFPGIDQINFQLPAGTPEGCYVPLVLRAGGVTSNFTTISVSSDRRVCRDDHFSYVDMETAKSTGRLRVGTISLSKLTVLNISPGVYDEGDSDFVRFDQAALSSRTRIGFYRLPYGSCTVVASSSRSDNPLDITENAGSGGESIDIGVPLNLSGPSGAKQMPKNANTPLGGGIPGFTGAYGAEYLTPGAYTVDNGNGNAAVGPFRATLTLPAPVTWTDHASLNTVNRSQDLTVTWSGGDDEKEYMIIQGLSTNTALGVAALFSCVERPSAGRFSVPSLVLSSLPASGTMSVGGGSMSTGLLYMHSVSLGTASRFQVQGLDAAFFGYALSTVRVVKFQ